jgi:hypothetical protein
LQDINKKSFDLTPILTATIQVSPGLPIYIQRLRIKAPAKHSGGLKRDSELVSGVESKLNAFIGLSLY